MSGVVLAAGRSERFGSQPKQLVSFRGQPLVRYGVRAALDSALDEVIVVVGHRGDEVRSAIADLDVRVIDNPDYLDGQSTTIQRGLSAIDPKCEAVMMIVADQPLLTADLLDQLLARYRSARPIAVQPTFGGQRGSPVILDRSLFDSLRQLSGDEGGRRVLKEHSESVGSVESVEIAEGSALRDVDTLDDLKRLESTSDS